MGQCLKCVSERGRGEWQAGTNSWASPQVSDAKKHEQEGSADDDNKLGVGMHRREKVYLFPI